MQSQLKLHLERARQILKDQADRHRSDRHFQVKDWVFLKVQPNIQKTIANRPSHKLAFRYFGPLQVEAKVGKMAYRLRLPSKTLIHPIVHVSLLCQAASPATLEQVRLSPEPAPGDQDEDPLQVLQSRQYLRGSTVQSQVLIQWAHMCASLATWEDEAQLRACYPTSPAWGQDKIEGRYNVMSAEGTDKTTPTPGDRTGKDVTTEQRGLPQVAPAGRPTRLRRPNTRLDAKDWEL
jgi:hypothetical protein